MVDFWAEWVYNCYIQLDIGDLAMKKITIHIPQDHSRTRAHLVLFTKDSPFKPKVVKSRMQYQRNPKHKGKIDQ